ncbi:MAG: HNH endonuclease [Rhodobacteraceae bacterium]|nr:HNH endonuclease [Paracoccaceae bacterium]
MMKPLDDFGRELDASFSVEKSRDGFDLVVESRGGSNRRLKVGWNSDYAPAMEQHLSRMGKLGMTLQGLQVASTVAMKLPKSERAVTLDHFPFPIVLSKVRNFQELRYSIGRASAAFGRSESGSGGNRTKRMRLRVHWPAALGISAEGIERLLGQTLDPILNSELPTYEPDKLEENARIVIARIRAEAKDKNVLPPSGQKSAVTTSSLITRFVRDPNVIAWVLHKASGRCEVCDKPAPFFREDGEPYLEVHHICPLSEGGPDTTDNTAACCPNCHRMLHHGKNRNGLRLKAITKIPRLIDYLASAKNV